MVYSVCKISIHALREEGDREVCEELGLSEISIHALREEGDFSFVVFAICVLISIHALREEGDPAKGDVPEVCAQFLSTPSARRATSSVVRTGISFTFLSTPSARRAT